MLVFLSDDGETGAVRVGVSASPPRRTHGELPRATMAARPQFLRNAPKQPKDLRQLCVPPGAREAGCPRTAHRQQPYVRRSDGGAGTRDDLRPRHRVNHGSGRTISFNQQQDTKISRG